MWGIFKNTYKDVFNAEKNITNYVEKLENDNVIINDDKDNDEVSDTIDNVAYIKKSEILVILDNGHGVPPITGGKQSPDGELIESIYTREITSLIQEELYKLGIDSIRIVTEKQDIPLGERVKRINHLLESKEKSNCILISVHLNALGSDSKWYETARGWECHLYTKCSSKSEILGSCFCESAKNILSNISLNYVKEIKNKKIPLRNNNKPNYTNLYITKNTNCPAILTENLFMTNKAEKEWLLSDEGKKNIVKLHVEAIEKYIEYFKI